MYIHTYITRDLYTIVNSRAHSMQYMYMYIYLLRSGSQRQREVGDWVSLGVQLILNIPKKKKKRGYHHASREHYTVMHTPSVLPRLSN